MRKSIYYIILFLIFSCSEKDNEINKSLEIDSISTYGGSKNDTFISVKKTSDNGYIVVGHTQSSDFDITQKNDDSYDYWIIKFNSTNEILWKKTFGGSNDDRARDVLELNDGAFLITGFSRSSDGDVSGNNGNYDFWVIKLSSNGNLIWEKNYGFSGSDQSFVIQQTNDGGFLLGGTLDVTASGGEGNSKIAQRHAGGDYWLIKIDTNGNKLWSKYYGGQFSDTLLAIEEIDNGNIILAGFSDSTDSDIDNNLGGYDFWIIKTNNSGSILWKKNFGGSQTDEAFSLVKTNDNHFIVSGRSRSFDNNVSQNNGSSDIWITKIDFDGKLIWEKNFGGSSFDESKKIIQSNSNDFYIVGSSRSNDFDATSNKGNKDVWLLKIDVNGNLKWEKSIGGSELDEANSITELPNGNLIIAGESWSSDFDIEDNRGFSDGLIITLK